MALGSPHPDAYLCFPRHLLHIMVFMASRRLSCSRLRNTPTERDSSCSASRLLRGGTQQDHGGSPKSATTPLHPPTHSSYSLRRSGLLTMSQAARSTLNAASARGCSFLSGCTWRGVEQNPQCRVLGKGHPAPVPSYQHSQAAIGSAQLCV